MKYKSKTDYWLVGLLMAVFAFVGWINIVAGVSWIFVIIFGVVFLGIVMSAFFLVRYEIADGWLTVKCAGIANQRCEVKNIKSIKKTWSIESSPASSLDRIEVRMADGGRLVVSPKDKKGFAEELRKINPDIDISGL